MQLTKTFPLSSYPSSLSHLLPGTTTATQLTALLWHQAKSSVFFPIGSISRIHSTQVCYFEQHFFEELCMMISCSLTNINLLSLVVLVSFPFTNYSVNWNNTRATLCVNFNTIQDDSIRCAHCPSITCYIYLSDRWQPNSCRIVQEVSKYFDRNYSWKSSWHHLFGDKKGVYFCSAQEIAPGLVPYIFISKNSRSISIRITVGYADGLACLVTRNVFFFAQRRGRLRSRSRTSCHTSSSAEVCPSRFFIVGSLTIVW